MGLIPHDEDLGATSIHVIGGGDIMVIEKVLSVFDIKRPNLIGVGSFEHISSIEEYGKLPSVILIDFGVEHASGSNWGSFRIKDISPIKIGVASLLSNDENSNALLLGIGRVPGIGNGDSITYRMDPFPGSSIRILSSRSNGRLRRPINSPTGVGGIIAISGCRSCIVVTLFCWLPNGVTNSAFKLALYLRSENFATLKASGTGHSATSALKSAFTMKSHT